jgi:hypothetical protein
MSPVRTVSQHGTTNVPPTAIEVVEVVKNTDAGFVDSTASANNNCCAKPARLITISKNELANTFIASP